MLPVIKQQGQKMTNITKLLQKQATLNSTKLCDRAERIEQSLLNGQSYRTLGGKQLTTKPSLIRFRIGIFRLIFERQDSGYKALMIVPRKHLARELKRR